MLLGLSSSSAEFSRDFVWFECFSRVNRAEMYTAGFLRSMASSPIVGEHHRQDRGRLFGRRMISHGNGGNRCLEW